MLGWLESVTAAANTFVHWVARYSGKKDTALEPQKDTAPSPTVAAKPHAKTKDNASDWPNVISLSVCLSVCPTLAFSNVNNLYLTKEISF